MVGVDLKVIWGMSVNSMNTTLSQPDIVVLIAIVLVGVFFFLRATLSRMLAMIAPHDLPQTDFLLAGRTITLGSIRFSTAATYSAFATVLFWFVAIGGMYSYWLFLIPITLYFGNVVFVRFVERSNIKIEGHKTIGSYLRSVSQDRILHRFTDFVIFIGIFSALIVEINVGSEIFYGFLPGVPGGQLFFIVLFSVLILGYIILGGYRAVIVSDALQLFFAAIGVGALVIFAMVYLTPTTTSVDYLYSPSVSALNLVAFFVSVIVIQFFAPLCQLQNWHRISSAENPREALNAHKQGALIGASLWTFVIVATLVLNAKLGGSVDFLSLFADMQGAGVVSAFGLYPLVFVGLVAAMLSTADSAMAAVYLFSYDIVSRRLSRVGKKFTPKDKHNVLVGIGIFTVIILTYLLFQSRIHDFTISVIYFLFNQLLVVFPTLYFFFRLSRYKSNGDQDDTIQKISEEAGPNLRNGMIVGWLLVAAMFVTANLMTASLSVWNIEITPLDVLMLSSGTGVAVAWLFSLAPLKALRSSALGSGPR